VILIGIGLTPSQIGTKFMVD